MIMNSLDIYLIDDINKIINKYQIEINNIYNLEQDLRLFKLYFTRNIYNDYFRNMYVKLDIDEFIIIIDNNRFYNKEDFYHFFHNLSYTSQIKLFYIFMDILLKKYKILNFEEETYLFDIFTIFIYDYLFSDYKNKTIKNNIIFDFIYAYKILNDTNVININKILKRLTFNTKIIMNNKCFPTNF